MIDYPAVAALAAVIETQSFQNAAIKISLTQSAISQRIKSLEKYYGAPVLIRSHPYRATPLGLKLLGHFKRITLLEESLNLSLTQEDQRQRISVAVSRDTLETWFIKVIDKINTIRPINLEVIADDQEKTLSYLKSGIVSACASTAATSVSGCKATFLGYFDYIMVSSPTFRDTYFKNQHTLKHNLLTAPAIRYDNEDHLHAKYLKKYFDLSDANLRYHTVPSIEAFRHFAVNGYAYALIPRLDIMNELKNQQLVNLFPDKQWAMPVYWHHWEIETKAYQLFNNLVIKVSHKYLRQKT